MFCGEGGDVQLNRNRWSSHHYHCSQKPWVNIENKFECRVIRRKQKKTKNFFRPPSDRPWTWTRRAFWILWRSDEENFLLTVGDLTIFAASAPWRLSSCPPWRQLRWRLEFKSWSRILLLAWRLSVGQDSILFSSSVGERKSWSAGNYYFWYKLLLFFCQSWNHYRLAMVIISERLFWRERAIIIIIGLQAHDRLLI